MLSLSSFISLMEPWGLFTQDYGSFLWTAHHFELNLPEYIMPAKKSDVRFDQIVTRLMTSASELTATIPFPDVHSWIWTHTLAINQLSSYHYATKIFHELRRFVIHYFWLSCTLCGFEPVTLQSISVLPTTTPLRLLAKESIRMNINNKLMVVWYTCTSVSVLSKLKHSPSCVCLELFAVVWGGGERRVLDIIFPEERMFTTGFAESPRIVICGQRNKWE